MMNNVQNPVILSVTRNHVNPSGSALFEIEIEEYERETVAVCFSFSSFDQLKLCFLAIGVISVG
jgi:hypothetical protein